MPHQREMTRFTTKQLTVLVLLSYDGSRPAQIWNPTLRDLQDHLRYDFGRKVHKRHLSRLLSELDQEGIITRDFNCWYSRPRGTQEQATKYGVVDLYKAFDIPLSDKEQQTRQTAREKRQGTPWTLPARFSLNGWKPGRAYMERYGPFHQALAQADLGLRYPRGDPRNIEKVKRANDALIQESIKQDTH